MNPQSGLPVCRWPNNLYLLQNLSNLSALHMKLWNTRSNHMTRPNKGITRMFVCTCGMISITIFGTYRKHVKPWFKGHHVGYWHSQLILGSCLFAIHEWYNTIKVCLNPDPKFHPNFTKTYYAHFLSIIVKKHIHLA